MDKRFNDGSISKVLRLDQHSKELFEGRLQETMVDLILGLRNRTYISRTYQTECGGGRMAKKRIYGVQVVSSGLNS